MMTNVPPSPVSSEVLRARAAVSSPPTARATSAHTFRWIVVDRTPLAVGGACSCGWEHIDGGRYVRGNHDEVRARFRLHLIDVDLDGETVR